MDRTPMITEWGEHRVFVTGGTGLLGSAVIEALVNSGAEVTCLLRDWVPTSRLVREGILDRIQVVHGGLEDAEILLRAINEYEIDTVFHLGAQTIVGTAIRSAVSTFESNIRGTWNLLEACRECSRLVKRVMVASSDKAYGPCDELPYTEDTPLRGRYPYDASKSCADLLSFCYYHSYGVPVAVTRCGNLFGPGDLNFNRIIPGTIRSVLRGEAPTIRTDGSFVRDYFYVQDAVSAYLTLAAHVPEEGVVGEAWNFGNETPMSVLEIVQRILELMDRTDLQPHILNQPTHEIPRQYLDCTKARTVLNWSPGFTLDAALQATIDWYRGALGSR